MADEELKPPETSMIEGTQIRLSNDAIVWGGAYKGSTVWKFVSKDGAVTRLALSREAVSAIVQIYQGLIGCDPDFAAVGFESLPDSASPVISTEGE